MAELGYFILGFMIVFFGGLYYLYRFEMFDMYDNEEDEWD